MDIELLKELCDALKQKELDRAKEMLDAGADPNGFDDEQDIRPPMVKAAAVNFIAGLELLRQRGGLVDGPEGYADITPLISACVNNHLEASHWLVRQGADAMKVGIVGASAIETVIAHGHVPIAQMLTDEFPQLRGEALTRATEESIGFLFRSAEMTKWLLGMGVSPDLTVDGSTWLMMSQSSKDGFAAITEVLLAAGANLDAQNESGLTALHFAAELKSHSGFLRLLRAGANPDIPDNNGQTLRQFLENSANLTEMRDLLMAWEASHAAHQVITESSSLEPLRPLWVSRS